MKMAGIGKVILMILLVGMVSACGKKEETQDLLRVSVIFPHDDDGYWSIIKAGMTEAYNSMGEDSGIDVKIMFPTVNYDISQMVDLLKQQLAASVDVIVVQGNNDEAYLQVLKDAVQQGIQVIFMDTDVKDFPEHLYIGTNNYEAGYFLGEKLLEEREGTASIRVISGRQSIRIWKNVCLAFQMRSVMQKARKLKALYMTIMMP